jgi:small-conductance mechanosensitive channel
VHSQVGVAINAALKAAGIEIPFPQRDVTLRFPSREET